MRTYEYRGKQVTLERSSYQNNGTVALIMNEMDGEEFAVVTVNLNHPLQSNDTAFLDENNYPGIGNWIERNGLGSFTEVRHAMDSALIRCIGS